MMENFAEILRMYQAKTADLVKNATQLIRMRRVGCVQKAKKLFRHDESVR